MTMSDEIIVALIGLVGSGVGSLIGVIVSSKLTQYRLEQLEKKVEAHNNLIDRTYKLEAHEQVVDTEIEMITQKIEDIENHYQSDGGFAHGN